MRNYEFRVRGGSWYNASPNSVRKFEQESKAIKCQKKYGGTIEYRVVGDWRNFMLDWEVYDDEAAEKGVFGD